MKHLTILTSDEIVEIIVKDLTSRGLKPVGSFDFNFDITPHGSLRDGDYRIDVSLQGATVETEPQTK